MTEAKLLKMLIHFLAERGSLPCSQLSYMLTGGRDFVAVEMFHERFGPLCQPQDDARLSSDIAELREIVIGDGKHDRLSEIEAALGRLDVAFPEKADHSLTVCDVDGENCIESVDAFELAEQIDAYIAANRKPTLAERIERLRKGAWAATDNWRDDLEAVIAAAEKNS